MKRGPGGRRAGGMPSGRASDAAERSAAVYFANLKADLLLHRELQVLTRAENSFLHRVLIDQKILFRRFQAKLRRSKLARARLWGDKDTERQLRARDLHVLNTNCGQEQDDLQFLKKLAHRPYHDHVPGQGAGDKAGETTLPVTDQDLEEVIRAVMGQQDLPATEKHLRSLGTIGRLLEEANLVSSAGSDTGQDEEKPAERGARLASTIIIRPGTSPRARKDHAEEATENHLRPETMMPRAEIEGLRGNNDHWKPCQHSQRKRDLQTRDVGKIRPRPLTSPAWSQSRPQPQSLPPKTSLLSPPVSRRKSTRGYPTPSPPAQGSRRPSRAATSMFEEQEKVDPVALRLEEARNTDFAPRVSAFIQTLLDLDRKERTRSLRTSEARGEDPSDVPGDTGENLQPEPEREEEREEWKEELKGDRKFDYYATKMALYAASVKKAPPVVLPGTPEEVNMKLVGNPSIKSITMPPLYAHLPLWAGGGEGHTHTDPGPTNILLLDHLP